MNKLLFFKVKNKQLMKLIVVMLFLMQIMVQLKISKVLGTGLLTVLDALRVEGAANDVVTHTRQVLHTAATDQNHGVFLKVVAFTADVGDDFETVREAHLGNLTESGVRLLRRRGVDARANATLLRAVLQSGALALVMSELAGLANKLVNSRHIRPSKTIESPTTLRIREDKRFLAAGGKNPLARKACDFRTIFSDLSSEKPMKLLSK